MKISKEFLIGVSTVATLIIGLCACVAGWLAILPWNTLLGIDKGVASPTPNQVGIATVIGMNNITSTQTPGNEVFNQQSNTLTAKMTDRVILTPTKAPTITLTPTQDLILFSDNFDGESGMNPAWRQIEGEWGVVDQRLKVIRSTSARGVIAIGEDSWDNYSIDFDTGSFHLSTGGGDNSLSLLARMVDDDNAAFYQFTFFRIFCGSIIDGQITQIDGPAEIHYDYHVHIEMKGPSYKMKVNDSNVCSFQYPKFTKGAIQIRVTQGPPDFPYIDNFVVKRLP